MSGSLFGVERCLFLRGSKCISGIYGKINWGQVSHPLYGGCLLFGGSVIRGFTVAQLYTVQISTWSREPQLSAHNSCIIVIPTIITHCPPYSIDADLHSACTLQRSISQAHSSISAALRSCIYNVHDAKLWESYSMVAMRLQILEIGKSCDAVFLFVLQTFIMLILSHNVMLHLLTCKYDCNKEE